MGKSGAVRFLKVQEELHGVLKAYRNAIREIDERLKHRRTEAEVQSLTSLRVKLKQANKLSFKIASEFVAAMAWGRFRSRQADRRNESAGSRANARYAYFLPRENAR